MPTPAQTERRSIIRMGDLANTESALRAWKEIGEWNPELSVRGLAPFFNAYHRFVYEQSSCGLLATNRIFDVRRFTSGRPLAVHVVGSTGVGKDAVLEAMNIPWVLSDTERPLEPRDIPGKTYRFVTKDSMDNSVNRGELIDVTRVQYRDGNTYRYGIHRQRVLKMIESGIPVFAFRTNQDGFTPISNFCDMNYIPVVRVFILPNCPASEYFERVRQERGEARMATARAEIQYTPELYRIDAILGNPFEPITHRPIQAASVLGSWLQKVCRARLPQPTDGITYTE